MANSIAPGSGQTYAAQSFAQAQQAASGAGQNAAPGQSAPAQAVAVRPAAGGDAISAPPDLRADLARSEAVVPPLLQQPAGSPRKPQDAAAADAFASAQGSGMAAVSLLAASLVVIAAGGVPLLMELNDTRAKTKLELKRQEFEHAIREIDRSAKDSTLLWVRDLETRNVDPGVVALVAAEMNTRWNTFTKHVRAAQSRGADAAADPAVRAAFDEMRELDMPLSERGIHAAIADERPPDAGLKVKLSPDASFMTMKYTGMYLAATRKANRGDGDVLRLFALQSDGKVQSLLHNYEYNQRAIALGTWAASRHLEFDSKLSSIHEKAVQRFLLHRLPVGAK